MVRRIHPSSIKPTIQFSRSNIVLAIASVVLVSSLVFASIPQNKKSKRSRKWQRRRKSRKNDRVSVGVGVIVLNENRNDIVVGLRMNTHGANTWAFPGGWLKPGESFENCGLRELEEETGLTKDAVKSCSLLDIAPYINELTVGEHGKKFYSVTAFVLIKLTEGEHILEVKEKEKCAEWRWIPMNSRVTAIDDLDLFPSLGYFLQLDKKM